MTCQRIEGSESSSQCMTDFLGSGPSRWGVLVAICCHLLAFGKETVPVAEGEIFRTQCTENIWPDPPVNSQMCQAGRRHPSFRRRGGAAPKLQIEGRGLSFQIASA